LHSSAEAVSSARTGRKEARVRASRVRLFDEWAKSYDESVQDPTGFPFEGRDDVLAHVARLAHAQAGARVLDVGIGTGGLAARLVTDGCEVCGLDFSVRMLARARERLPGIELIKADLLGDWPVDHDRRFDGIVSAYVFHEFDLPGKVKLVRRFVSGHLVPTGRMVIGDISFETATGRSSARREWDAVWDEDEHYWAADEAIAALAEAGLAASYTQVSFCGGVYAIGPAGAGQAA
jgi:putative AdoMet-dependent methyltransferase